MKLQEQQRKKLKIKITSDLNSKDSQQLEVAINKSTEFANSFAATSSNNGFLDAIEKHLAFSKAYEKDPKAAVAQYGIGSQPKETGQYILSLNQGQMKMIYMDIPQLV